MTINGKQISTRFGMLAVEVFLEKTTGKNLGSSFYSSFGIASIIYAGMVNFYSVKEEAMPCTFEEIYNHVEDGLLNDAEMEDVKAVVKEFEGSQALKKKTEMISKAVESLTSMKQESLQQQPD